MSTNIFFPADRLEALTTVLKEYGKQNDMFGEDCTLSDMLYQFGVETYTNRGTGDLVVDRLGDYADLHLVTRKAIAVLTDFVQSTDDDLPFMEFVDDDARPFVKLVLQPGGTWSIYEPVLTWKAAGSL